MNHLPLELQNHIYSFLGTSPTAKLINELVECKEIENDLVTSDADFETWLRSAKSAFAVAMLEYKATKHHFHYSRVKFAKHFKFNPFFYKCAVLDCGAPCVECSVARNWLEMNTEGYDGMCEECYEGTYYQRAPSRRQMVW
jgi:hypothetical protein